MSKNKTWKRKAKRLKALCHKVNGYCYDCPQQYNDSLCFQIYNQCANTPFSQDIRTLERHCKNKVAKIKTHCYDKNILVEHHKEKDIPQVFSINEIESAIKSAIKEKKYILLYPKNLNLIAVTHYRKEQEELIDTSIFNYNDFNTEEEFTEKVMSEANNKYNL